MQKETLAYIVGAVVMLVWQVLATPWIARLPPQSRIALVVRFLHGVWLAVDAQRAKQERDVLHAMVPTDTTCASTASNVFSGCVKGKGMIAGLLVVLLCSVACVRSGKNPCTAYSEREYWFGGGAKLNGALALAASGTAIPVQGDRERTALAIGAATTGATSLAMMWLADSASTSYDEQCRKEPVK